MGGQSALFTRVWLTGSQWQLSFGGGEPLDGCYAQTGEQLQEWFEASARMVTSRIKMNTKTNRHASKPLSLAAALAATNLSKLHARGLRDPDDVPKPTHLVLLGFFEAAACPPPPPPPPPPWPTPWPPL